MVDANGKQLALNDDVSIGKRTFALKLAQAMLCETRPEITMEMADAFLTSMYSRRADFVLTVDRDFVRTCQTPVLILPDDIPAHPYATAMETAMLAPKAQVSIYPWKENARKIELALTHIRSFLAAPSA